VEKQNAIVGDVTEPAATYESMAQGCVDNALERLQHGWGSRNITEDIMTGNDTLSAALSKIRNAERVGKKECSIKPVSKVIKRILDIMNQHSYIGKYDNVDDGRGGMINVHLIGNINKCGTIKPRFSTQIGDFEKWEKRYLPAKDFGVLVVSTSKGMMTHSDAKKMNIGGKLIAYIY
jgi:small subunit ribosomal protein S8